MTHLTDAGVEKLSGAGERVDGLRGLRAVLRVERERVSSFERGVRAFAPLSFTPGSLIFLLATTQASGTPLLSRESF